MSALTVEGWAWMQALGWTLLHFLWQGLLVGGVFAVLRRLIPKQNASARYANGLLALALLALLPLATLLVAHARQDTGVELAPVVVAAPVAQQVAVLEAPVVLAPGVIDGMLPGIVFAWLAGVLLVVGRSWYQWRRLMQVARRWSTQHPELEHAVLVLAARFGFVRRIRVLVSDRIDTPTLIGWLKPVILLPAAVALGFPRQQVELILAHELGHLRRYDHLVNLGQVLLETLFFYHPVVHWIGREVRHEREICCDTLVLRVTRGEPRLYARTLAALEELRQPLPTQLVLAASGGVLVERVRRILGVPSTAASPSSRPRWLPAVAALTLALGLAAMTRTDRLELRPTSPAAPAYDWTLAMASIAPADLEPVGPVPAVRIAPMPVPRSDTFAAAAAVPLAPAQPSRPPRTAQSDARVQLAVADIAAPDPRSEAVVPPPMPAAAPPVHAPVATRMVSPEYPYAVAGQRVERVELGFAIAPNGAVTDIAVVSAPADRAFTRAAENALKQWRFDPASVPAGGRAQFRQAFVFALDPPKPAEAGSACVRRTGTLLCQRDEGGAGDPGHQTAAAMPLVGSPVG